jgi:NAD(P)H-flavin reductase
MTNDGSTTLPAMKFKNIVGFPTPLLRKVQLVTEGLDRLPVYTLTFAIPDISSNAATATESTTPMMVKSYHDLRLDLGDVVKMIIPNYKPKSYSVSALRSTEFDVTYKLYPNGRASGYLHQLKVGGETPIHTFVKKNSSRRHNDGGTHIGIIVYGVGITEGLPVARAELERGHCDGDDGDESAIKVQHVILIWCVRTMADAFWQNELQQLTQLHPQRFQIVYVVSREQKPSSSLSVPAQGSDQGISKNIQILYGQRINAQLLQELFEPFKPYRETVRFLSVGTKEMMAMTDDMLCSIQYPMPHHSLLPKI